jgi:hypothetical protein
MENEKNEGKIHSSGPNIEELRLLFSRIRRWTPGRLDGLGRFVGVIASKFARNKPRKEKSAA